MTTDLLSRAVSPGTLAAWAGHLGEVPDPEALRTQLCAGTLPAAIAAGAQRSAADARLEIGGVRLGPRELVARARRAAGWMRSRGVRPGERILLVGATSVELVTVYLGTLFAGATAVPADLGSTDEELLALAVACDAVLAWVPPDRVAVLRAAGDEGRVPRLGLVAAIGAGAPSTFTAADAVAAGPEASLPAVSGAATAMLAFTSGTTGRPKGVPLSHANLLASVRGAMRAWRWSSDDRLVHALPLSHQHGLSGLHAALLAGSSATILDRFDPELLAHAVQDTSATVLFAVPAMYARLCQAGAPVMDRLRGLRLAVSGSAPLDPGLAADVAVLLGEPPLERYGSTETGLSVSNLLCGPRVVGSVGYVLPGLELAIVDRWGAAVEADREGEVALRGPQVMAGYLDDPEATDAVTLPGGWLRTGDLGRVTGDGLLTLTGRLKELIISGGMNVSPREVELTLEAHPGVARAAVAGAPSERWGEMVVAAVVPAGDRPPTPEELADWVRARLSPHKRPKRIGLVEDLPVNRLGKVLRQRVPALLEAQGDTHTKQRRSP